jgi:hypothetical protein
MDVPHNKGRITYDSDPKSTPRKAPVFPEQNQIRREFWDVNPPISTTRQFAQNFTALQHEHVTEPPVRTFFAAARPAV